MDKDLFDGCDPADICDAFEQLHGVRCLAQLMMIKMALALEDDDLLRQDGVASAEHWISIKLNVEAGTARKWVKAGRRLEKLPKIAQVFQSGRISFDQLILVVEIAEPETDAEWAERVVALNCAALRAWVRHRRAARQDPAKIKDESWLDYWWNVEKDRLHLRGHLDAENGAIVASTLDALIKDQPVLPDGQRKEYQERAADALVELASTVVDEEAEASRPLIVIHVPVDELQSHLGAAEIEGGGFITSHTVRRLACDARIQTLITDGLGKPLGVGRASRNPPPWLMRQVRKRDRGCRFPGCSRKRFLQAHHIKPWGQGGPTDLENLILLCSGHHHLVHDQKWTIDPSTFELRRPDGEVLRAGPSALRREVALRIFPEAVFA